MAEKKSWRDVYKVHPAANLFPMLPEDELRKLGEDIKANGLRESIVLWSPGNERDKNYPIYLLDGRNRLAAMELVGVEVVVENGSLFFCGIPSWASSRHAFEFEWKWRGMGEEDKLEPGLDPYAYVISKNIHRRHLTKEQQADLIVKVLEAKRTGLAKMAKPVKPRNATRQLQGQVTKDPIKQEAVEEAKKHGVSQRTVERSLAKHRGPQQAPRKEKSLQAVVEKPLPASQRVNTPEYEAARRPPPAAGVDDIVRKIMAFIDKNLTDKSHETLLLLQDTFAF